MSDHLSAWSLQTIPPREGPALQRSANATPSPSRHDITEGVKDWPTWLSGARVLLCLLFLSRRGSGPEGRPRLGSVS